MSGISSAIAGEFERNTESLRSRITEAGEQLLAIGDESRGRFIADAGAMASELEGAIARMQEMTETAQTSLRENTDGFSRRLSGASYQLRGETEKLAASLEERTQQFQGELASVVQRLSDLLA